MRVSLERVYRIWDDTVGYYIQIADARRLGMMEISYWQDEVKMYSVNIGPDMFELFLQAVKEFTERKVP
jgi:hypothetical protein